MLNRSNLPSPHSFASRWPNSATHLSSSCLGAPARRLRTTQEEGYLNYAMSPELSSHDYAPFASGRNGRKCLTRVWGAASPVPVPAERSSAQDMIQRGADCSHLRQAALFRSRARAVGIDLGRRGE